MGEHACPQGPECRIGGYSALGGQVVALDPPTQGYTRQRSLGPGKQVDQQHVVHSGAGRGQARLNPRDVEQPGAVALAEAQHGHRLLARTLDMKARIVHFTQHGHDRSVGPDRCEATHQCRPNAAAATVGSRRQIVELAHTRSVLGVQGGADRNLVIDGDDQQAVGPTPHPTGDGPDRGQLVGVEGRPEDRIVNLTHQRIGGLRFRDLDQVHIVYRS